MWRNDQENNEEKDQEKYQEKDQKKEQGWKASILLSPSGREKGRELSLLEATLEITKIRRIIVYIFEAASDPARGQHSSGQSPLVQILRPECITDQSRPQLHLKAALTSHILSS